MGKGLTKTIKRLIVALWKGEPLTEEQEQFCESLKEELEEDPS